MRKPVLHIFNYTINNKSKDAIDIHIDGDIVDAPTQEFLKDWFGDETSVSLKSLRNQIEQANPKTVDLWVNSTGGHVGDAMAMHDYLKDLENKGVTVNRHGRGIVSSAATYLVMGNNSDLSENSFFGIHNIQSVAFGDIVEMENQVKNARKFNDRIVQFYSEKTGKTKEEISNWMNDETWFTAQEAKDNGFVSNISGQANFKNKIDDKKWNYKNQDILRIYNSFTNINPINMDIQRIQQTFETSFNNLLEKLGLKDKKDEQPVKDAINECSLNIANAIKEAMGEIKKEEIETIVNNAIDSKKFVTEDIMTEKTKNLITNDSLTNALKTNNDTLTSEMAKLVGDKSNPSTNGGGENNPKNKKYGKYANASGWEVE